MGPCRISSNVRTGVCGIDAAGMVMRNLIHLNMLETEAYTYHAIEAAKTLKATAEGKTPFEIKDEKKLIWFAEQLGIETEGRDVKEIAIDVAELTIKDLSSHEPSKLVEALAPEKRKECGESWASCPTESFRSFLQSAPPA